MSSVTLQMSAQAIRELESHYHTQLQAPVPYSVFRAKANGVTITAYESGKVLFQGKNAEAEASQWGQGESSKSSSQAASQSTAYDKLALIGSDEVGNGSYFGPLIVCAAYVTPEQFELVRELGAQDSKNLSDEQIRDIAWQLKATVPYHLTNCPPVKYNEVIGSRYNAVSIKVSLHNFTIQKLYHKLTAEQRERLDGVLIDQFTPEASYRKYLAQEAQPYTDRLYFEKRGESAHLAVACASIIARDAFLESLETLGKPYGKTLPSGAGPAADQFAAGLLKAHGEEALAQTAKLHFRNTEKARKLAGS